MYNVTVHTTGHWKYKMENLGPSGSHATVEVKGQGPIGFNDVGERRLGPNDETWGVCITFRNQVWAYRYERDRLGELDIFYDGTSNSLSLNPRNGSIAELTS